MLSRQSLRLSTLVLAVYTLLLSAVLGIRSLWLDELLQALGTRDSSLQRVIYSALISRGGVPLPYVFQKWTLDLFRYSLITARLPAAVFSVLSAAAFVVLCRQLNLRRPLLALLIFLAMPLLFRYGIEARGYSQGLFFALLSCNAFLALRSQPARLRWLLLYFASLLFGLYSQPFSIFLPIAQSVWLIGPPPGPAMRHISLVVLGSIAIALLCFVPWLLIAHRTQIDSSGPLTPIVAGFAFAQIRPSVIVRELSGGGFACSLTMLILAAGGWHNLRKQIPVRRLLGLAALLPIVAALVADAVFDYFFAARQLIFALPALAALAAEGIWPSRRWLSGFLLSVFFIGCAVKDAKQIFFSA